MKPTYFFSLACVLLFLMALMFVLRELQVEHRVGREYVRHDFRHKKGFENFCVNSSPAGGHGKIVVFHIAEFQTELLPFFDPANLIQHCKRRSSFDAGLNVMGMNLQSSKFVNVENFPFLSYYQWCWNQRVQSSRHLYSYQWTSFHNQRFLNNRHDGSVDLKAVMQATMDPLFRPQTLLPSAMVAYHDLLILSHRCSAKAIPYMVHFMTRRVLTCAFGSLRISYIPWKDARKYVQPKECVMHTPSSANESKTEWIFSPTCNLKHMIRFAGFTLHQGQSAVIPPFMVYQLEHILPSSKREKFEQCCIVLQADYVTANNRFANWVHFTSWNDPSSGEPAGAENEENEENEEHPTHRRRVSTTVLRDEVQLQNNVWEAQFSPDATFMKPEVNVPLKEDLDEKEWMSDIVYVNQSPVNDAPANVFSMAVPLDQFYRTEMEEAALKERFDEHAKDFPQTSSFSAIVDI